MRFAVDKWRVEWYINKNDSLSAIRDIGKMTIYPRGFCRACLCVFSSCRFSAGLFLKDQTEAAYAVRF